MAKLIKFPNRKKKGDVYKFLTPIKRLMPRETGVGWEIGLYSVMRMTYNQERILISNTEKLSKKFKVYPKQLIFLTVFYFSFLPSMKTPY